MKRSTGWRGKLRKHAPKASSVATRGVSPGGRERGPQNERCRRLLARERGAWGKDWVLSRWFGWHRRPKDKIPAYGGRFSEQSNWAWLKRRPVKNWKNLGLRNREMSVLQM